MVAYVVLFTQECYTVYGGVVPSILYERCYIIDGESFTIKGDCCTVNGECCTVFGEFLLLIRSVELFFWVSVVPLMGMLHCLWGVLLKCCYVHGE
jgi:hypothetical protein